MRSGFEISVDSTDLLAAILWLFTTKGTGVDSNRVEMPNGTGNFRNFQISRKKDNLRRLSTIFETNFQKRSVPFDFVPEFPEILVKWIAPVIFRKFRLEIVEYLQRYSSFSVRNGTAEIPYHLLNFPVSSLSSAENSYGKSKCKW